MIDQSGNGIRQLKQVVKVSIPNLCIDKTLLGRGWEDPPCASNRFPDIDYTC